MADHLDVHKSTASRLMQTLEAQGFATHDGRHIYRLGHRLFALSSRALAALDIRALAAPQLRELGALTGETIHLAALEGDRVVYIDKVESSQSVRMYSSIGKEAPLYCTGVAKAIMAFQPEAERQTIAGRIQFERFTSRTLKNAAEWLADLSTVRQRGYAMDDREHEDYVHCIAAPIRSPDGSVAHAVSVSATTMSKGRRELMTFLPALLTTAHNIAVATGFEP